MELDELESFARDSHIASLAQELGCDLESWLQTCISPLPETIRLNPLRHDSEWTAATLESFGARRIEWTGESTTAYTMPWAKGGAPEGIQRTLLQSLHNTGRHTRQESVSMLPAVVLDPRRGEKILDACAAPGSKSGQLAELIADDGVIVANEPNSGRLNKLVTNKGRLALRSVLITQHDTRTFPRVPPPGFDAILADVPCSGTGTVRKNKSLWWDWKPSVSRSLHALQLGIALRASKLLKPGGRMVYSTCSIDPLENEAVVAHLLRSHEWLELESIEVESCLPGLVHDRGIKEWDPLGGDADDVSLRRARESHIAPGPIPPDLIHTISEQHPRDEQREQDIAAALEHCIRVQPDQNDSGGFFVALLRQIDEGEHARGLLTQPDSPLQNRVPPDGDHGAPTAIDATTRNAITEQWGEWSGLDGRLWMRGRKVMESSEQIGSWLYDPQRFDSSGRQLPGGHWHPLKVRHLGRMALEGSKQHPLRPKAELLSDSSVMPSLHLHEIDVALIERLLDKVVVPVEELPEQLQQERSGAVLLDVELPTGRRLMPAWVGTGLRMLINEDEVCVLRAQLELGR